MILCNDCIVATRPCIELQQELDKLNAPQSCTSIYVEIVNEGGRIKKSFSEEECKHIPFFKALLEEHKKEIS